MVWPVHPSKRQGLTASPVVLGLAVAVARGWQRVGRGSAADRSPQRKPKSSDFPSKHLSFRGAYLFLGLGYTKGSTKRYLAILMLSGHPAVDEA